MLEARKEYGNWQILTSKPMPGQEKTKISLQRLVSYDKSPIGNFSWGFQVTD